MARIPALESSQVNLFTRFIYWMTKRHIGRVILPVKVSAHHPRILRGTGEMERAQLASHSIPETLKELASIKAAMLVGCPF
jgi:hypothetical protein